MCNVDVLSPTFHRGVTTFAIVNRSKEMKAGVFCRNREDVMKKSQGKTIGILSAAILLVAVSRTARADDRTILTKVPFAFGVPDEILPAGSYIVSEHLDHIVMSIASPDSRPIS